jgi:HlyD family secretion protein
MDRTIAPEVIQRRRRKQVVIALFSALAALFFIAASVQWLRPSVRRRDLQFARVEHGRIEATLQAGGTLLPAHEQVISAPVEARVLRIVRRAGDHVRAGDELVTLDTSATRLSFEQMRDRVSQKESALTELHLKLDDTSASLSAQIEQKKLDGEILRFKAVQNRKLHEAGLVPAQEDLAAATAARKNEVELANLQEAVARSRRSEAAQISAAVAELRSTISERDQAMRQLELASMRADRDGIVTSIVQDSGSLVRVGDMIARIADLSSYRAAATISDVHAAKLAAGMRVRVRVDDATSLAGRIATIEPRTENGSAKFWVELDEPSHPRLRNNVRVDVFVVTGERDHALRVARGVLGQGALEEVWVARGTSLVRVPVRWGVAGQDYIEATSGLREGDQVVISDMTDYAAARTLRLE